MTSVNDIKAGYWLEKQDKEFPVTRIKHLSNYNMLFFGFVSLNPNDFTIDFTSSQKVHDFVNNCKNNKNVIKAILSVGALAPFKDDTDVIAASKMFSDMARTEENRKNFVNSAVDAAKDYKLDGIDLAWEFPTFAADDMLNFAYLLGDLRQAFKDCNCLLSAVVHYKPTITVGGGEMRYDVEAINNNLDFVNVVCYDYCDGAKCLVTCADSRLRDNIHSRAISAADGISAWMKLGVNERKLVMGIPMHGKKWELANPDKNDTGSPANYKGVMAYKDIADFIDKNNAKKMYRELSVVEYCFSDKTWITYDALKTIPAKIKFAKENDFVGYFLFSLDSDSKNNDLSAAASQAWDQK